MPADEILLTAARFRVVRRGRIDSRGQFDSREIILHPGAVAVVPLVEPGRICLIRNYRTAVERMLVEIPAGTLEPGEAPAVTADRELAEETGFIAGRIESIGQFQMSPGILNERMHVFAAHELREGPTRLEVGEDIERLIVAWDEALAMIDRGEIEDAKTIAALLLYDRRRSNRR